MEKLRSLSHWTSQFKNTDIFPVLFVGHGNPMNALADNEFTRKWNQLGRTLPRPNAILVISAHWETRGTRIMNLENPPTIHDFGGFPKELFEVQYPAPGSPQLAFDIQQLLKEHEAKLDEHWGLDHGTWSVVKHIYPLADIPVVQLSLNIYKSPKEHFLLAKELQSLRRKGVLIIGSGNMVHNLGKLNWHSSASYSWADEANEAFKNAILDRRYSSLIDYQTLGSTAQLAIPTEEHFLPLLYTLSLSNEDENIQFFNDQVQLGSISMTSVIIG